MNIDLAKARDIFLAAVEKSDVSEKNAFVDQACGTDGELRRHVNVLLSAHQQSGSFLDKGALADATIDSPITEKLGMQVGPYKLLQELGEGGMGIVYMAEQTEPVSRRVALKIVKPGMDTRHVIARFEAEGQALAMMEHPNIANVLDAGQTDSGRPYFVMELVKGVSVTQYCDEQHLTPTERLKLFMSVCQAVQHAHHKGVIHRDIKPSNILVALYDDQPVPKVIDFGVAKAMNQRLTEKTIFTRYGQVVGTLEYMSPEQAKLNQLDIDTRSDIYSLGVLLYELLTGSTPINKTRLRSSELDELLRAIREEDPPTPSTRLASSATLPVLAANRNTEPKKLAGLLRGDLDWIVMKAVAKERSQRYQTAEALAADVQRHLHDKPIEARRPSTISRAARFVRRNKLAVVMTTLVFLSCTLAASLGVVTYWGHLEKIAEAARAERQRWARETAMPTIKRLLADGRTVLAFRQAKDVQIVLPDDPAFQELWDSLTATVTFKIDPPGTKVFIRDWDAVDDPWWEVGETPLVDVTLPRGDFRFRYVKQGYITREFQSEYQWDGPQSLTKNWGIPEDMVLVDGVRAARWNRLPVDLGDFLIDRHEVSNVQFQGFVDAGGYEDPEYWTDLEFVRDSETLTWQQAMQNFHDTTGDPGPATWHEGRYPHGQADYPVSGVSWYEAMAFAKFSGKSLPTVHHWQWSAFTGEPGRTIGLSNFSQDGPARVGAYQGITRVDVYDMAGNVEEWCWNMDFQGCRCLRGGAWSEAGYRFLSGDAASPWDRSETYGFRCIRYLDASSPAPATLQPWQRRTEYLANYKRQPFESLRSWYRYDDKSKLPLNEQPVEPKNRLSGEFRHEIVRIDAAYNQERFDIHFFVPLEQRKTYETIVYGPTANAWFARQFPGGESVELVTRLVGTGRMVCWPIQKGTYERGIDELTIPLPQTVQVRDMFVAAAKDIARTLDYLHTRSDVNTDRIVYLGYSAGVFNAVLVSAMYPGLRAAIMIDGGYPPHGPSPERDVFHPVHFTRHVKIPVLMINGLYDTNFPYQSSQLPFFEDLGTKVKKHVRLENGHGKSAETIVRETEKWFRATLAD